MLDRGSCIDDCSCVLCRELTGCGAMAASLEPPGPRRDGVNFILRRGLPFRGRSPTKEWLEAEEPTFAGYEDSATLEDKSHGPKAGRGAAPVAGNGLRRPDSKDVAHKTVIYFGDTNQRQKEASRSLSAESPRGPLAKEDARRVIVESKKEEDARRMIVEAKTEEDVADGQQDDAKRLPRVRTERQRSTVSLLENEDAKVTHEIVVNVSPSREDVLRIEEDESQVEDYWSLPGDNTGFKADWSFVQQWRLRG